MGKCLPHNILYFKPMAFLAIFLLVCMMSSAQPVSIPTAATDIDSTSGTIGQKFHLTLTVKSEKEHKFQILSDADLTTSWTQFSEIKQSTLKEAGGFITTAESVIVPFETGQLKTPNYIISWLNDNGTTESIYAPLIDVNINSVLEGNTSESLQLKNIKSPVTLPFPLSYVISFWTILALICTGLLALIFRKLFKKIQQIYQPREPHLEALHQLEQIQKEHLIEHKKYKEYYTKVSSVIRNYIGTAYHIDSEEKTSYELLELLRDKQDDELMIHKQKFQEAIEKVTKLLNDSDMVKFAKATPDSATSKRAIEAASEIVNLTSYKFEKAEVQLTEDDK